MILSSSNDNNGNSNDENCDNSETWNDDPFALFNKHELIQNRQSQVKNSDSESNCTPPNALNILQPSRSLTECEKYWKDRREAAQRRRAYYKQKNLGGKNQKKSIENKNKLKYCQGKEYNVESERMRKEIQDMQFGDIITIHRNLTMISLQQKLD